LDLLNLTCGKIVHGFASPGLSLSESLIARLAQFPEEVVAESAENPDAFGRVLAENGEVRFERGIFSDAF
jgi:hypothetical protein